MDSMIENGIGDISMDGSIVSSASAMYAVSSVRFNDIDLTDSTYFYNDNFSIGDLGFQLDYWDGIGSDYFNGNGGGLAIYQELVGTTAPGFRPILDIGNMQFLNAEFYTLSTFQVQFIDNGGCK